MFWTADFLSKEWVIANLPPGQSVPILGEVLQFTFVRNPGAAFSIASGLTWILTILALIVVVVIVSQAHKIHYWAWALGFGLLLGGVLGNLYDRIFREPGAFEGHVIDFIHVGGFPAIFNIADSAICVAMGIIVLLVFRGIGLDGTRNTDEDDEQTDAPGSVDTESDANAGSHAEPAQDVAEAGSVAEHGDDEPGTPRSAT
ncbi:signal peptidase II [Humidisolicoccus flavus]|uniref:signal peptidase II n=1 Tax=Humidisolicoccus flavus TaxID=3111414 RepID=UPI00324656C6